MQPDQDKPQAQPLAQPDPYAPQRQAFDNVPEYLHMEPVVDPGLTAQKKRKRTVIISLLILFIVAAGSGAFALYAYIQQNTPQEKFYKIIGNQLQVQSITKKFTFQIEASKSSSSYETTKDFSTLSKPKLKTVYELNSLDEGRSLMGEEIMISPDEYLARVTDPSTQLASTMKRLNIQTSQWYRVPNKQEDTTVWNNEMRLSPLSIRNDLLYGFGMTGMYSQSARDNALNSLRMGNVYTVKSTEETEIENQSATKYVVKVDNQKLAIINQQLMKDFGGRSNVVIGIPTVIEDVSFWVKEDTGLIVRIEFKIKNGSDTEMSKGSRVSKGEINYLYDSKVVVEQPVDINELP